MAEFKKIEICTKCSGLEVDEINSKAEVKDSCIGKCSKEFPELNGKFFGFINDEFTVCDTKEAFLGEIDESNSSIANRLTNSKVDEFIINTKKWRDEFNELRRIVLECGLAEELKWGQPCYMFERSNIVILSGFKEYIALAFFKGVLLKDSSGILIQPTENMQETRQIRFTNVSQIVELKSVIKSYIIEAVDAEKSGLKVNHEKRPELEIPEELQKKFDESPAFKTAFESLTPGRQRGYILFFSGAKQSKTREARIEKYTQQILDGKGLED